MLLIGPGRLLLGDALHSSQKRAGGRHELIDHLDQSLQPGVVLLHLASKLFVIRGVRGIHVT
jgi:hypothetical protein